MSPTAGFCVNQSVCSTCQEFLLKVVYKLQKEHVNTVTDCLHRVCLGFAAAGDSSKQSAGDIDDDDEVPGEWW